MTPASCKMKGRRLQQWVVKQLVAILGLDPEDLKSTPMGSQGADVIMGVKSKTAFPYAIECKNSQRINLWEAYEQAQAHAGNTKLEPLLVIKKNHRDPLVVIDAEHFFSLVRRANHEC